MSTVFGHSIFPSDPSHSNHLNPITALKESTSFPQPTSTSSISKQKLPITEIEESKAILAGLIKIEQISADWRQDLNKFGITEDLETEKNYIKNIKIYIDLVEENIKKKAQKNRLKFLTILDKIGSFVTGG